VSDITKKCNLRRDSSHGKVLQETRQFNSEFYINNTWEEGKNPDWSKVGVGFLQSEALPVAASNNMRAAACIDIAMEGTHAIPKIIHGEELHVHGTSD
jgi:hypothetical protein